MSFSNISTLNFHVLLVLGSVSNQSDRPDDHKAEIRHCPAVRLQGSFSERTYKYACGSYLLSLQSLNILQTQLKCGGVFILLNQSIQKRKSSAASNQQSRSCLIRAYRSLTARWFILFHPLSLGAAPPVAPALRSPTNHDDPSASAHLRSLPRPLPRW